MKRLIFSFMILILFGFPSTVLADVAPPYFPPGFNPQPDAETTQVRMAAETVLIEVQNDIKADSLGSARVSADFSMDNLGSSDESMAVRFPIAAQNGRGEYPEISDIVIKVDGKPVNYRRAVYPISQNQDGLIPWAEFDVTFPAGKETAIQVSYSLRGTGYPPYTAFFYILETGAGWKDTIGSADIILRLPYPANAQNIVLDSQIGWSMTTQGANFQGNEVRWHFEDFEPGPESSVQNMEFALVSPAAWHDVLTEREKVKRDPNDGEAWGRLGKAYKQIFFMNKGYRDDPGGGELYQSSIEAYEKCLAILPKDAQWHAGFADLLVSRSYWDAWGKGPSEVTFRGLKEIHTALDLAPNDAIVREIATNISYMFPDGMVEKDEGFDFPWLTQTPTPIPPTAEPVFDAEEISGSYQSDLIRLSNDKKVQLVMTLYPNQSVSLESRYEDEPTVTSTGVWKDNGDGTLTMAIFDPKMGEIEILFRVNGDRLEGVEFPAIFGDGGFDLVKPGSASTEPAMTTTLEAAASDIPEGDTTLETPTPSQASQTREKTPLCGSAALIPMAGIIWGIRGRATRLRKSPTK